MGQFYCKAGFSMYNVTHIYFHLQSLLHGTNCTFLMNAWFFFTDGPFLISIELVVVYIFFFGQMASVSQIQGKFN